MSGQGLDIGKPVTVFDVDKYYDAFAAALGQTSLQELIPESLAAVREIITTIKPDRQILEDWNMQPDQGVIGWDWYNIPNPDHEMIERDGDFESTSDRLRRESSERVLAETTRRSESLKNYLKANPDGGAPRPWLRWAKL